MIPPHNTDAERAIFSIVISNPGIFIKIADKLETRDFYNLRNQEIWQAMYSLYKQGKDIDIVSIKIELKNENLDYRVALKELSECYNNLVIKGNIINFVKEVKNKSLLRQIISTMVMHKESANFDNAEAVSILTRIERDIIDINDSVKDNRSVNAKGILKEIKFDIDKGDDWKGFNTGFEKLDSQSGGLLPTHCWIVGSYTGMGKTFFMLQMILNVLKQGAKVILFSTEMDRKMNILRMLGNLAGIGTINILKDNIDDEERIRLKEAEQKLRSYSDNLLIYDNVYTVEEIRLKAKKQKLRNGLDIIFVDFIQNLKGDSSIYERMSNAAINLQQVAQELKVTMVLASQVTQASAGWKSKGAIEYKGAGEIAAIADVGLWIKPSDEEGMQNSDGIKFMTRQIILRKMRHGLSNRRFDVRICFPSGRVITMVDERSERKKDAVQKMFS